MVEITPALYKCILKICTMALVDGSCPCNHLVMSLLIVNYKLMITVITTKIRTLVITVQVESLGTSIKKSLLSLLIPMLLSATLLIINVFDAGCSPGM